MNFLGGSIRIGQLFGINLRVHVLFLIWIGYILLTAPAEARLSEGLFWGMLFGIVLLHELGHCFGARIMGGEANDIMMWPLGGLAYAAAPMRPWPQFVTVAAGPAVNVLLCLISGTILATVGGPVEFSINPFSAVRISRLAPVWVEVLAMFYHVNYFLLAFNCCRFIRSTAGRSCIRLSGRLWPAARNHSRVLHWAGRRDIPGRARLAGRRHAALHRDLWRAHLLATLAYGTGRHAG
jgi:hypothetical protein